MAPPSNPVNREQQVPWTESIIIFEYMPLHMRLVTCQAVSYTHLTLPTIYSV